MTGLICFFFFFKKKPNFKFGGPWVSAVSTHVFLPYNFAILKIRFLTRALQSTPFQIPWGVAEALGRWKRRRSSRTTLIFLLLDSSLTIICDMFEAVADMSHLCRRCFGCEKTIYLVARCVHRLQTTDYIQ